MLLAHDPGARLGRESESLHQMRVPRDNCAPSCAPPGPCWFLNGQTRCGMSCGWLGQLLGTARDLDVQLSYFREESAALDARDAGL